MTSEIKESAETTLETTKELLQGQFEPQEYESKRDECYDKASACKTVLDCFDNEMDELKKQKRRLDDRMAELRTEMRPWKALYDDLKEYAERCNNSFWDAKNEMKNRNLPDKQ